MKKQLPILLSATAAGLMLLLLSGCSTGSTVVTGTPRDPIDPEQVQIHRRLPPDYEEIAMVQANSKGALAFTEQDKSDVAIARLKEEAAKLGANGVLLKGMKDGRGGTFSLGVGTGSYSHSGGASVGASTSGNASYKIAHGIALWVPQAPAETIDESGN